MSFASAVVMGIRAAIANSPASAPNLILAYFKHKAYRKDHPMKEAAFRIKSGNDIIATGSIFHEDGKSLDSKAINAAAIMATSLGYLHTDVVIWRPSKNGGESGHKRAEPRTKVKDGEPKYKAVAAN
jgi:hypothetical protein